MTSTRTSASSTPSTSGRAAAPVGETLGQPAAVPAAGWRQRVRSNPALYPAYRVGVFLAGLACCAVGVALAVLPGPLTIPPVLLGLWIWSTEFKWAQRLFDSFKKKAQEAWAHAKTHPVSSAVITVGGLVLAGVAFWAVSHYQLVDKAKAAVGL